MVPRLYVPLLGVSDRTIDLPDDEAGHLRRVLRVKAGAAIRLFDGRGREVAARVAAVLPDRVVAEIGDPVDAAAEWGVRVTLAQAVLKGDKIDEVIRDAVMMGVSAMQLLVSARTEVPAPAWSRGRRLERWQRIAVSSAKQCGRAVVPAVLAPAPLGDVLAAAEPSAARLMLVEPSAARAGPETALPAEAPAAAVVLVGPEGGWSAEDLALAMASGCLRLSLGPRTLRADAAAVVALSVMQYAWRLGARD